MTNTPLDELGPVDYVVEFPAGASSFTGEMAKELVALADAGSVDAVELSDIPELGELEAIEADEATAEGE